MSKREFNFKQSKGARKFLTWKKWLEGDFETSLENVEEGDLFGLNSNGALNYKMEDVEVGTTIRVEYEGMDTLDNPKSPFHGKEFHKIDLQIDESSINVEQIKEVQDSMEGEDDYGEAL